MQVTAVNVIESCETSCILLIYYVNMHFFEKYVRMKIEDHKILVLNEWMFKEIGQTQCKNHHKYTWMLKLLNFKYIYRYFLSIKVLIKTRILWSSIFILVYFSKKYIITYSKLMKDVKVS